MYLQPAPEPQPEPQPGDDDFWDKMKEKLPK